MLHCIMTMTMTGGEEEEGDECARSVAEYPGTVRMGMVFPFSVATICRKLQLLSTDERVSGSFISQEKPRATAKLINGCSRTTIRVQFSILAATPAWATP